MNLHIQNYNKVIGYKFWNARFVCTNAVETDTNYRFQFEDTDSFAKRYIWIEVSRFGNWNKEKWEYKLNYPKCPQHMITANYIEDFNNVINTFGMALKNQ